MTIQSLLFRMNSYDAAIFHGFETAGFVNLVIFPLPNIRVYSKTY